jgi:hypothetical protein
MKPPRERKTIGRAMRLKTHQLYPGRTANGRYHLEKWQAFLDAIGTVGHTEQKAPEPMGIEAVLKNARIRTEVAQAEKLERENALAAGKLAVKAEIARDLEKLFAELVAGMIGKCRELAPSVIVSREPADAEKMLIDGFSTLFEKLALEGIEAFAEND